MAQLQEKSGTLASGASSCRFWHDEDAGTHMNQESSNWINQRWRGGPWDHTPAGVARCIGQEEARWVRAPREST